MKILILFNHPAPYKIKLFNGLAKFFDVHVIFERTKNKDRNPLFYKDNKIDFTLHPIKGIHLGNENHLSSGVIKHLKNNVYDLIIINGYSTFTEMKTINFLKKHAIPYYFYINGGIVKQDNYIKLKLKRHFISGAAGYFSPSIHVDDYLTKYGCATADNIYHYPYSTVYEKQINKVKTNDEQKKTFFNNKNINGDFFFVSVTTLSKRKNNFEVIKMWHKRPKNNSLILIGDGNEKRKYLKYIEKHNLSNVYIIPFIENSKTLDYLKHSHGAIYVSKYDIYGHVINEALSCGTNVLASTNMMATNHLINNYVNGITHKDGDDLDKQIDDLLKYDFYKNAIDTAKDNTIEQMVEAHVKIIKELKL